MAENDGPESPTITYSKRRLRDVLNKLCHWRTVYAGWQLGTRSNKDPEARAVRDAVDARLVMRAELNAVISILQDKKIVSEGELLDYLTAAAIQLDQDITKQFPGFETTAEGLKMDRRAAETMKGWRK